MCIRDSDTDDVTDNSDGDEDDHDPAPISVEVFDLALTKVYTSDTFEDTGDGIIEDGADVTFTITVFNQGSVDSNSFEVTDFIPTGFVLNDAAWTDNGDGTASIAGGPLAAGDDVEIGITLTADSVATGDFVNWAEISSDDGDDIDSTPDTDQANDAQPDAPGDATDDVTDNTDGDEDDHDPAGVSVANFDLALTKVYTSDTFEDTGDAIIEDGADVTFTITVFNQGTTNSTGVTVTDYLPSGFVLSAASPDSAAWTDNGDGTASTLTGPITAGGSVDVTITLTAVNVDAGDFVNIAEISADDGNDIDSTPDDDPDNDDQPATPAAPTNNEINNADGDEDDHDIAGVSVEVFDLALTKVYTSDTFGGTSDAVIDFGAEVTFTITVFNQGTVDATTFDVTDYLPAGFVLSGTAPENAGWTNNGDGTATFTGGPLAAGDSVDIEITLVAGVVAPGTYVNGAEITSDDGNDADSTPDIDPDNDDQPSSPGDPTDDVVDNTDGDEDDHDIAGVGVENFDLALIKALADDGLGDPVDGVTEAGSDVTFTITVINQGTIDATTFDVTDYFPAGFVLNDVAWTDNGDGTAKITGGPLAAGDSVDIDITLTAQTVAPGTSVNIAEISADDGNDIDSTPDTDPADDAQPAAPGDPTDGVTNGEGGDSDDHDIAGVTIGEFDLALQKVYTSDTSADGQSADGAVQAGDDVTFTITVTNQGTIDADTFDVTDYFPAGFVLNDVAWTDNGDGTATISGGPLAAGESVDIDITLTAQTVTAGVVVNTAEISSDPANDIDSTPDTDPADDAQPAAPGDATDDVIDNTDGDEDDHDIAGLVIDVYDLAIEKDYTSDTSDDGNATDGVIQQGDDATFTITVTNEGTVDASNVEVTDYLPVGFVLNDVAWTDNGDGTATISVGAIPAGGSVDVTITMTAANTGAGPLVNWAEISADDGDDIDSTPNTNPDDDGTPPSEDDIDDAPLTVDAFDLALTKVYSSDTGGDPTDGTIAAGDDVTFTITVLNQGTVDAANIDVTDYFPSGFVLSTTSADSAIWTDNGDDTATATVDAIVAGGSAELTITLTAVNPVIGAQTNIAEISNDDGNDIDSIPNTDVDDDGPVTDDEVDNAGGDEDDHDPAPFVVAEEPEPEELLLSLGNVVWFDDDNDGIFDEDELPVAGVVLALLDGNGNPVLDEFGNPRTETTDANGNYLFDALVEGTYIVAVLESNFVSGGPLDGVATSTGNNTISGTAPDPDDDFDSDDNGTFVLGGGAISNPIELTVGGEPDGNDNFTVDFGFTPAAGIGTLVWVDQDRDGIQDANEPGVPGVTVEVFDAVTGELVGRTVTNADGEWEVTGLPPGDYTVTFTDPEGRSFTSRNSGSDDALDSDVASDGTTTVYSLSAGEFDPTADAGIVIAVTEDTPLLAFTGSNRTIALAAVSLMVALLGVAFVIFARRREDEATLIDG